MNRESHNIFMSLCVCISSELSTHKRKAELRTKIRRGRPHDASCNRHLKRVLQLQAIVREIISAGVNGCGSATCHLTIITKQRRAPSYRWPS